MLINSNPEKILIMNLTRMGDLIQSTPLIKGLRTRHPSARITLLVGSDFAEFAHRLPGIDDWIVFDLKQFKNPAENKSVTWVDVYRYFEATLDEIKLRQFDLVMNLSHSKLSAFMIAYLGIARVCGFKCNSEGDRMTEHPWLQYFFTEPFNRPYNTFNLVDIFSRGGDVALDGQCVEIRSDDTDRQQAQYLLDRNDLGDADCLIGLQAGSSLEGRRWPAHQFAELADRVSQEMNAKILLFGVASETPLAQSILKNMRHPECAIDLTGKTSIASLIDLVKRCQYLITNDTGTMHIAAAVDTPIVGLFFAHAHPPETGPYAPGHLIFQADIPCAPCSYGVECNNIICIEKVRPDHIIEMMLLHRSEGDWQLPVESFSVFKEMRVYRTEFDADFCLRMRPLNKPSFSRNDLLAQCYRRLWLDTLQDDDALPDSSLLENQITFVSSAYSIENKKFSDNELEDLFKVLREVVQYAQQGSVFADQILQKIKSSSPNNKSLKQLAQKISSLDEKINLAGLTHPELKPVTDMFNKRKENIDAGSLKTMSIQTGKGYKKLGQECQGLEQILKQFVRGLKGYAACEEGGGARSIKMEVPGR